MDRTTTKARTIGCDVGDRYSHLCVLDAMGVVIERARLRSSRAAFGKWFADKPACLVALEVGGHSRWLSLLLSELGHEVLVANARQVRLIYGGRKKNDRLDAENLARLARLDRKLLAPIKHRGPEAQAQLAVIRSRDTLVKARTELINHVRGVAKAAGFRFPKCTTPVFAKRARPVLPDTLRPAIEPMLTVIETLSAQIKTYDQQISAMAQTDPVGQLLTTINGVGALTALAFSLTIEDPHRFASSRDVAAYLGLVPKQRQSGDQDPAMRISRAGDPLVRRLLVQCAHHILNRGPDSDIKRFGLRLLERGGPRAKKKAVIAMARKLAVLMHRLWTTGEVYRPLRPATPIAA
jgi:transposase